MITVKFKKLREGFELPKKSFDTDACFDVKILDLEINMLGDKCTCYLGFSTEIPEGWKGVIVPRSSLTKEYWAMLNSPGQIDSSYRGEWQMRLTYVGDSKFLNFPFKIGDRIAQIYFEKVNEIHLILVDKLSDSERSNGGFGHTGN